MGTVNVVNPADNPKKKAKKAPKQLKCKGATKAGKRCKRTSMVGSKYCKSHKGGKGRKATTKAPAKKKPKKRTTVKKKKAPAKKKGKPKKRTVTRTTTSKTTTKVNPKRRAAGRKAWRTRKRNATKRRRKWNPKRTLKVPKSAKGVERSFKKYFPKMEGAITAADAGGAISGALVGTGLSGLTKMATDNEAAGVIVHAASWLGGTLIIKNVKAFGKPSTRQHFARGWFVADGIAFGIDAGFTIYRHFTRQPSVALTLQDIETAPWFDKIKVVFQKGLGNPEEFIGDIGSRLRLPGSLSGDYDLSQEEDILELIDELERLPDLSAEETAYVEEIKGLAGYITTTRDAASYELVQ